MINAGFNPLSVISEKTGKSIGELKKEMEAGAISSEMVADAFKSATAVGGKFYGMTQKQAEGIRGLQAQLEGAIQDAFDEMGKSQESVIASGYKMATSLVENYRTIGEALTALVATYGIAKAAMVLDNTIGKTVNNVRNIEESKSLESLVTTEQRAAISKQNLTKGTIEYANAVKSAALANVAAAKEQVAALGREASAQNAAMIKAKQRAASASEIVTQRKAELAAIIGAAEAEKVASLQKMMVVESEKQSRSALLAVKLQEKKAAAITQAQELKESKATEQKIIAKNREIAVIHNKIAAAKAEEMQHAREVSAIRSEIKAINGSVSSRQVEAAQKKLDTAITQENTAILERNTAMKTFYSQKVKIQVASQTAATMATKVDTATNIANASATNILSLAKKKLIIISKNLWATLAPNPYVLLAAAVVALGYGIYKLVTYQTDAEKAQTRLNEATKEYNKSVEAEQIQIDILFNRLRKAKDGTEEFKKAKDDIISKYGSYLDGLSSEIKSLKDVEAAYKAISAAAIQSAKDRAIEKGTQGAVESYTEKWGKNIEKIQKEFVNKFGEVKTDTLLSSLKDSLSNEKELSKEVQDAIEEFTSTVIQQQGQFGGSLSYEKNDIKKYVSEIVGAKKILNNEVKSLESIFGESKQNDTDNETKKIKTFAEQTDEARKAVAKLKQELADLRSGKAKSNNYAKDIEDKAKALKEAEDKLSYILTGKASSSSYGESAAQKAQKEAQQKADLQLKIDNDNARAALDRRDQELENQQAEINLINDGFEKQQKQIELNHKKELLSIERRAQELIEKKQESERKEWDIKNPNGSKTPFKPSTQSFSDLSYEDITQLINSDVNATKAAEKAKADSLNAMLAEYQSYADKYASINKKFNDKIASLEAARTSENSQQIDNSIAEAKYQQEQALEGINNEFAQREETFQSWVNQITELSLSQLQSLLANVQNELKNAEKKGVTGPELAVARAKVDTTMNQIKSVKTTTTPGKRSIKEWQDLNRTLNDVKKGFKEVGDAIGGTVGDIMSSAGDIASSTIQMIDGIVTLANSSSTAIEKTSETADKSIKAVEKASVILAIISAALQIAMKIADMLGGDDTTEKYNQAKEAYQSYIAILDKVIEKQLKLAESLAGDNAIAAYEKALEVLKQTSDSARVLGKQYLDSGASKGFLGIGSKASKGRKEFEDMSDEGWRQAAEVMGMSSYKFSQLMGSRMTGLFDLSAEDLANLRENASVFWSQLDSDTQNYAGRIADNLEKTLDIAEQRMTDYTLIDKDTLRNDYKDLLGDLDQDNKSLAKNFEKYLMDAILNSMLKEKYTKQLENWRKSFSESMENGTMEEDYDDLMKEATNLSDAMIAERDRLKEFFNWTSESDTDQSTTSGGFETMTQDQAGELNGRFTGLHETGLRIETIMQLAQSDIAELRRLGLISADNVLEIKQSLIYCLDYLDAIAKNTNELYAIKDAIVEIKKNTAGLAPKK